MRSELGTCLAGDRGALHQGAVHKWPEVHGKEVLLLQRDLDQKHDGVSAQVPQHHGGRRSETAAGAADEGERRFLCASHSMPNGEEESLPAIFDHLTHFWRASRKFCFVAMETHQKKALTRFFYREKKVHFHFLPFFRKQ